MSFEAVPCMITTSAAGEKVIGLIIRPSSSSGSQDPSGRIRLASNPVLVGTTSTSAPRVTPLSTQPLVITPCRKSSSQPPKVLMPATHLRIAALPPLNVNAASPVSQLSTRDGIPTPQSRCDSVSSTDLVLSPCSTPTPLPQQPSCSYVQQTRVEWQESEADKEEEESNGKERTFDDMPLLWPALHQQASVSCPPSTSRCAMQDFEDSSAIHGSECETAVTPSVSINMSMKPNEIAEQLMTAMDEDTVRTVTSLILKRSKGTAKRKKSEALERQEGKAWSDVREKKRRREASEDPRKSEEESRDPCTELFQYRLSVQSRLMEKVEQMFEENMLSFERLFISTEQKTRKSDHSVKAFPALKKRTIELCDLKREIERIRTTRIKEEASVSTGKIPRSTSNKKKNKRLTATSSKRREDQEKYFQIRTSEVVNPPAKMECALKCNCTRGACYSASDCLHKALRIFCRNSTCSLATCSNRFVHQSTLYINNKNVLRTTTPRKAHDFLMELAGELVTRETMAERVRGKENKNIRAFALSPTHFVDATERGNIARFVRHSCQPNAVLQPWMTEKGVRLCLFSRFPLATDAEITVDMNGLVAVGRVCGCNTRRCKRWIAPSLALAALSSPSPTHHPFMLRNLRHRFHACSIHAMEDMFQMRRLIKWRFSTIEGRMARALGPLIHKIKSCRSMDEFRRLLLRMQASLNDSVEESAIMCMVNRLKRKCSDIKPKKKAQQPDTTYLDHLPPLHNPLREEWPVELNGRDDAIRCVCGAVEEDGEMIQCDKCKYWLHDDCVSHPPRDESFTCALCNMNITTPSGDVLLAQPLDITIPQCTYYKALTNARNGFQVRLNECIYVRRPADNSHKKIIAALEKQQEPPIERTPDPTQSNNRRSEMGVLQVLRLFQSQYGHRFIFGVYFARPHETHSDSSRFFHPNEVFRTPLYDTLPLDCVSGRCLILPPDIYCTGRPLFPCYQEEDVMVCEYQVDRHLRHFEKCRLDNNVNTQPYAFFKFRTPRSLQRYFSPFIPDDTQALEYSLFPTKNEAEERLTNIFNKLTKTRRAL